MADLGEFCDAGEAGSGGGFTVVQAGGAAASAGTIDTCEMQPYDATVQNLEFGVVTDNGSNSLTCQAGHHCSGANLTAAPGACRQFTAPGDFTAFSCDAGEYIAGYWTTAYGAFWFTGYSGRWATVGDKIGDDITYTYGYHADFGFALQAYFAGPAGNPWYAFAQQ